MEPALARRLWHGFEAIHCVTYFAPEARKAMDDIGMRGFWMGYFAARAAPLGAVPPAVVEAIFFNFHPRRVRRALPAAWTIAAPDQLLAHRSAGAAAALERLLDPDALGGLADLTDSLLAGAIESAEGAGRPLFAANRALGLPDEPAAKVWQAVTSLREQRGDGHVALLTAAGLDGCEVHVLAGASSGTPASLYRESRGWNDEEWSAAVTALGQRGLVDGSGSLTPAGEVLHAEIEFRTDALARQPFERLPSGAIERLLVRLRDPVRQLTSGGSIPFPNPMGLPPPGA
jgi:hypothetical protein